MSNIIDISAENRILLIKARFKANTEGQNLFGQLFIVLSNMEAPESYHAIISTYPETYDTELHTNWDKYQEFIVERKWKGLFNINMTNSLNMYLNEFKTDQTLYKLFYQYTVSYDYDKLDVLLCDSINHVLHEKNLQFESVIQGISTEEYAQVLENRSKPIETSLQPVSEDSKKADDSVILKVKPVLAPVKGKPIYALKISDTIMVRITPDSAKQKEYIKIFKLEEDGLIRPIPADVVDIKYGKEVNDPYEILVKIDSKIFGKILEDEHQVKLRIYDPKIDGLRGAFGNKSGAKIYPKSKDGDRAVKIFILLLSIFLTIFLVVIIYVLMN